MPQNDEIFLDMVGEARDNLEKIEVTILAFEELFTKNKIVDYEVVNTLFRQFHSIKGTSGFFNLPVVVNISHKMESILDELRNDLTLPIDSTLIDLVIETKDLLSEIFNAVIDEHSDLRFTDVASQMAAKLIEYKEFLLKDKPKEEVLIVSDAGYLTEESNQFLEDTASDQIKEKSLEPIDQNNAPGNNQNQKEEALPSESKPIVTEPPKPANSGKFGFFDDEPPVTAPIAGTEKKVKIKLVDKSPDPVEPKKPVSQNIAPEAKTGNATPDQSKKEIRIDTDKLDILLDMVGELVIAESLVTQHPELKRLHLESFDKAASHLHKIVKSLQDLSLRLRMVPIEGVFMKMSRLIRDLSHKFNKKINFEVSGADTDVDKNVLENIIDPLIHILRNSVDHGIETSEERLKKGKSETGKILLEALNVGNDVWIKIQDDGRGLDKKKIVQKAIEKKIIEEGREVSDSELVDLIFSPGFSTASQVTDISGRGVGLDIVKKNLTKLNGDIELKTSPDHGTTFTLKLPMTMAIIEGMVISYLNKFYIIPTLDIKETLNLHEANIETLDEKEFVIRYRGDLVPIFTVEHLLHEKKEVEKINSKKYIIVLESRESRIGVVFDDIIGNQSVVIKPLPVMFKDMKGYSGCTILGNGNIGMILDIKYMLDNYKIIDKEKS